MVEYQFVTKWHFQAPIESVWEELADAKTWPSWWSCWKKADYHAAEPNSDANAYVENEVKGKLPYALRFTNELTCMQKPNLMETKSTGDLVGNGKIVLEEKDGGTEVITYWNVGTASPVFNFMGKFGFVKKMISENHDYVMEDGFRGLKTRLEQKQ